MANQNMSFPHWTLFIAIALTIVSIGRDKIGLMSWQELEQSTQPARAFKEAEDHPRFQNVTVAEDFLKKNNECRECFLKRSELSGLNLTGSDLEGANLQGTDLSSSDLTGANLRGAILRRADLSSVRSLKGADLTGADLTEANIKESDLEGAILCHTVLPNGSLYEGCDDSGVKERNGGAS